MMPKIIDVQMRRGRNERFIIKLDDDEEFVMTPEIVLKFGLSPEKEFTEEEFIKIVEEDNLRQAKDQAIRYLSIRQHSRFELLRKMREKGYRANVIHQALDDLENIDLVNDEQFTRLYIQNELRLRPVGRILLSRKLAQRGISREQYTPILQEYLPEGKELEFAYQLTQKFFSKSARETGQKLKEKLVNHLQSKGFPWLHIERVLKEWEFKFH
jgi:regulatory protein